MPIYYFHVIIGTSLARDGVGFQLADLDEAKAKAAAILRAVARDHPGTHITVDVEDDAGLVQQSLVRFQNPVSLPTVEDRASEGEPEEDGEQSAPRYGHARGR